MLSLLILVLVFGIYSIPAYLIYKDANKRGMNAILWAIFTFFFFLPSIIIYFVIREPKLIEQAENDTIDHLIDDELV